MSEPIKNLPLAQPLAVAPMEREVGIIEVWQVRYGRLTISFCTTEDNLQCSGSYAAGNAEIAATRSRLSMMWRLHNYRNKKAHKEIAA